MYIMKNSEKKDQTNMLKMWNNTDIRLEDIGRFELGASRQGWYLDREWKTEIHKSAVLLKTALPYFDKYLDLPDQVSVKLCSIKARGTHGDWRARINLARIDYKQDQTAIMDTLAHELVHAEQYQQGRLTEHTWMGEKWAGAECIPFGTTSFNKYWNFPWEVEARERSVDIASNVWCDLYQNLSCSLEQLHKATTPKWLAKNRDVYAGMFTNGDTDVSIEGTIDPHLLSELKKQSGGIYHGAEGCTSND
jgi:hypothetical protein